jgi:hypothetical protein
MHWKAFASKNAIVHSNRGFFFIEVSLVESQQCSGASMPFNNIEDI